MSRDGGGEGTGRTPDAPGDRLRSGPDRADRWYARALWGVAFAWLLYMAWLIPHEAGWLG